MNGKLRGVRIMYLLFCLLWVYGRSSCTISSFVALYGEAPLIYLIIIFISIYRKISLSPKVYSIVSGIAEVDIAFVPMAFLRAF